MYRKFVNLIKEKQSVEEVIKKHNFKDDKIEAHKAMLETLKEKAEQYGSRLNQQDIEGIVTTFSKKSCDFKNFGDTSLESDGGSWILDETLKIMFQILQSAVKDKKMSMTDCQACLINQPMIPLLKCGPLSPQRKLINSIMSSGFKIKYFLVGNIGYFKMIINAIKDFDFKSVEDSAMLQTMVSNFGEFLKELYTDLRYEDTSHDVIAEEMVDLYIRTLERRLPDVNNMIFVIGPLDFKKAKTSLAVLLSRFEPLYTDPTYPWTEGSSPMAGAMVFQSILDYWSNDEELPEAAIRPLINMFLYSMRDDVPKQEQDVQGRSRSTIHGIALLNILPEFVKQNRKKNNDAIAELVPGIMNLLYTTSGYEYKQIKSVVTTIVIPSPQLIAPHFEGLIEWFLNSDAGDIYVPSIIADVYPHNTAALTNHVQEVFQKLIPRTSMDIVIFFSAVAKHQPELYTEDNVAALYQQLKSKKEPFIRGKILDLFLQLSQKYPSLLKSCLPDLLQFDETSIRSTDREHLIKILGNIGHNDKECVKPVFDFLIQKLNTTTEENYPMILMDALQQVSHNLSGADMEIFKECLNKQKLSGENQYVRMQANAILTKLEGGASST